MLRRFYKTTYLNEKNLKNTVQFNLLINKKTIEMGTYNFCISYRSKSIH